MGKPIALLVTDTHLKESNIELVQNIWQQAILECVKLSVNQIFFLGDFFDSRKGQSLQVLKAAQAIINGLAVAGIKVIAIPGNHDKSDYESKDSYLDIFYSQTFEVLSEASKIHYRGIDIAFLPFFRESSDIFRAQLAALPKADILMTHIGINGSVTNDNQHIHNCVPSSMLEFSLVFCGHFHNRQEFENIVYIGSAYQANYGEDMNKGFTVLYDDGTYEFTLAKFPRFRKHTYSLEDLTPEVIMALQVEVENNHNVRVHIQGSTEAVKSFNRSILTDIGVDCVFSAPEALLDDEQYETVSYNKESLRSSLIEFCEKDGVVDVEYGLTKLQ